MGDPFWRRFSTARERSPQHSKERTLASEYANLNTRNGPTTTTSTAGRSRNDLFSTDWGWKGTGQERTPGRPEGVDGSSSVEVDSTLQSQTTSLGRKPIDVQIRVNDEGSESRAGTLSGDALAESTQSTLGTPFRLKSPTTTHIHFQGQQLSSVAARRSRNDTIYNVNHLTITPPRRQQTIAEKVTLTQSPPGTSSAFSSAARRPDSAATDDQNRPGATMRPQTTTSHPNLTGPSRSVSLESTSSCGDSVITSFTEQATDRVRAAQQPGSRVSRGDGRYSEGPISPMMSPTTPITPDAPNSGSFSSFSQQLNKAVHSTSGSGHTSMGWMDGGVQSPRSDLSLSRSSSLTIAQSPSRALASIKRKAEILLTESEDTSDAENSHPASGSGGKAIRVRADINSRSWLIGYGRYAKVFLGSYQPATTGWNLCAAKVFDADIESVSMARKENTVLQYLHEDGSESHHVNGRPYILESIGLIDETLLESLPATSIYDVSQPSSSAGTPTRSNTLNTAAPARITTNGSPGNTVRAVYTGHRRSASENTAMLRHLGRSAIEAKSPTAQIPASRPVLLLPFCANGTMAAFLTRAEAEDGVDEAVWSTWFQQGLAALAWCKERGVLHNDIKPSNFLLDDDYNLKLGDFGSAMRIDRHRPPHDGIGLGTVAYSSPEIVDPSPDRAFSFPSDMFAFGVTMRQCMTGREPYEGLRTVELMYHVRKGNYWEWQARQILNQVSVSPVALRLQATIGSDGVRRSESLREPGRRRASIRPTLARTPSSDVLLRRTDPVEQNAATSPSMSPKQGTGTSRPGDREDWLCQMVDPEPENRPTPLALLELARQMYHR